MMRSVFYGVCVLGAFGVVLAAVVATDIALQWLVYLPAGLAP